MAITGLNDLLAASRQGIPLSKASRASLANAWYSVFDLAGQPGAGVLPGGQTTGSTTAGIVPTDATPGYPAVNAFGGGATGYLSKIDFGNSVACRMALYDRLYVAGAFAFNAAAGAMSSQPSYAARLPNTNYSCCELWFEAATTFTGNPTVTVTYTNQAGTTGRTTGAIAFGLAPVVGRCIQLPLQAGDTGIQKIESVTCTVATVGTFNIMILRELWNGRVPVANGGDVHGADRTDLPIVYTDSALYMLVAADSTATGTFDCKLRVANI